MLINNQNRPSDDENDENKYDIKQLSVIETLE